MRGAAASTAGRIPGDSHQGVRDPPTTLSSQGLRPRRRGAALGECAHQVVARLQIDSQVSQPGASTVARRGSAANGPAIRPCGFP